MRRLFRAFRIMLLGSSAILVSCGSSSQDEPSSAGPSDKPAACNPFIPGSNGHLPACAAGTSTAASPGVPMDFAGRIQASMPISAAEQQAIDEANALAAARNPPSSDPIDRGFGAPRSKPEGAR